ncbi:unnamed protein product [Knipowitschia caucasica]
MSAGKTLRALVTARLSAAAEDIFALFERTIADYEKELRLCKEKLRRQEQLETLRPRVRTPGVQMPSQSPDLSLNQTSPVKQERAEQSVRREPVLDSSVEGEDINADSEDWRTSFSCSDVQKEADGNGVQVAAHSTTAQNSGLLFNYKSAAEASVPVNTEDMSAEAQGDDERKYQCDVCTKTFRRRDNLRRHRRLHAKETSAADDTEEKNFQCEICAMSFSRILHLQNHIMTHSGKKPFSCPTCNKTFTFKADMEGHIRTHTGEKPFSCLHCDKSFAQQRNLKRHFRTHTGERPYSCPFCSKTFSLKGNLTLHIRRHTGEKPFSCPICEQAFYCKSNLDEHSRSHTGERPYSCSICNLTFAQRSNRNRHFRKHARKTDSQTAPLPQNTNPSADQCMAEPTELFPLSYDLSQSSDFPKSQCS